MAITIFEEAGTRQVVVTNDASARQLGHQQQDGRRARAPHWTGLHAHPPLIAVIGITDDLAVGDCVGHSFEGKPGEYGLAGGDQCPSDCAVEFGVTWRRSNQPSRPTPNGSGEARPFRRSTGRPPRRSRPTRRPSRLVGLPGAASAPHPAPLGTADSGRPRIHRRGRRCNTFRGRQLGPVLREPDGLSQRQQRRVRGHRTNRSGPSVDSDRAVKVRPTAATQSAAAPGSGAGRGTRRTSPRIPPRRWR